MIRLAKRTTNHFSLVDSSISAYPLQWSVVKNVQNISKIDNVNPLLDNRNTELPTSLPFRERYHSHQHIGQLKAHEPVARRGSFYRAE